MSTHGYARESRLLAVVAGGVVGALVVAGGVVAVRVDTQTISTYAIRWAIFLWIVLPWWIGAFVLVRGFVRWLWNY
jgi:hypothetical protein